MYVSEGECKAYTTGFRRFAECLQHSAKPQIHSAKALPSAALGNGHSGKKMAGKAAFAESHLSGTRQSFCRVPSQPTAKKTAQETVTAALPSPNPDGTRQSFLFLSFLKFFLCRAPPMALGKVFNFFLNFFAERLPGWHSFIFFLFKNFFAEHQTGGTRQSF